MKVFDIMRSDVDFVSVDTPVSVVSRLIFGRGINGVPVCRDKKVVGFITERDILAKFFPSLQEYIEDPVHSHDFEEMEKKINEILSIPAKKIMSTNPITVTENAPLLRAESLMLVKKIGRLPVVDHNKNLIGIVSKGDIFKAVVGRRLSLSREEEFYDWLAKHYDILVDWKTRLSIEIPDLTRILKREKVKTIFDVAFGTGEHEIALAKEGFEIFGFEASNLMQEVAGRKILKLSKSIQERIHFIKGKYEEMYSLLPEPVDAVMCMGNSLPYIILTDKNIFEDIARPLTKNSLIIFQIVNFHKIFKSKNGLREFVIGQSRDGSKSKHAFLSFYTKSKGREISYNLIVLDQVNDRWVYRGSRETQLVEIHEGEIVEKLKEVGFNNVSTYGSAFYGHMFTRPFDPLTSDWLNVVAKRS